MVSSHSTLNLPHHYVSPHPLPLSLLLLFCVLQDPKMPAGELRVHYDGVVKEIEDAFAAIVDV